MTSICLLLLAGLLLSAFFSGCETGFYRATRFRLVLDALDGDWIARGLMGLINNPTLFVATILIGNNLANYLASRAIVLGVQQLWGPQYLADFFAAVVASPVVFIYAELLPKTLFYRAPNQLLRFSGPLLLASTLLFLPVSLLLWILGFFLQRLLGQAPLRIRLRLAQQELRDVLQQGELAGVLQPSQRGLADAILTAQARPVRQFCRPLRQVVSVRASASKSEILRAAGRRQRGIVPVLRGDRTGVAGYFRAVDLLLDTQDKPLDPLPMLRIDADEPVLRAVIAMQREGQELAAVSGPRDTTLGIVELRELMRSMQRGSG